MITRLFDMSNASIHVHADDETCTVNGLEDAGEFVIFQKEGGQRLFVNLDESLRIQLISLLMTRVERDRTKWGAP